MPTFPFRKKAVSTSTAKDADEEAKELKTFWEHLDDLRRCIWRILITLIVGFNACWFLANHIKDFLVQPLAMAGLDPGQTLKNTEIAGSFMLGMKLALYVSILLTFPLNFYWVADFVLPALKSKEKHLVLPVFVFGSLLFLLGVATAFFWIVPVTLRGFIRYDQWMGMADGRFWTYGNYFSFLTTFSLAMGVMFEAPLVVLILAKLGIVKAATLRKGRKWFVVAAFAVSAVLAPPDPLSMILMSLPIILLMEISIWLARLVGTKAE